MAKYLVGTLVLCSVFLLALQVFVSLQPADVHAQTVRTFGYTGVGTCDPSQTSSSVTATGMKEILQAEDMWDAGNHNSGSVNRRSDGVVLILNDGSSVWGTFSEASDNVVVQFRASDFNDGPVNIYVDGALVASNLDSWQQGRWYVEITGLSNTTHTVLVENAPGLSACAGMPGTVSLDWFGIRLPPEVTITDPPAGSWQTGDFSMQFDAQGVDTCEVWVDDGNTGSFTQQNTISSCTSGSTNIQVGASGWCSQEGRDECGVRIVGISPSGPSVQDERVFSIDYTPPVARFDVPPTPPEDSQQNANFQVQYDAADANIDTCTLSSSESRGSGGWVDRSSSCGTDQQIMAQLPGWCEPDAYCALRIQAQDVAGHVSEAIIAYNTAFTGGLVPCGRDTDDPNTNIDESQPCTLCHGFALVHGIIDFLLVPTNSNNGFAIVLLLGALLFALGGFSFLVGNLGNPGLRNKGRAIIFTTIIAMLIIYGAWLAVDFILDFFGVAVWTGPGNWWEISCG